jgi:hypothetical protein
LHQIDKINNKITGCFILKVFVQLSLNGNPISLRAIEALTNNMMWIQ